MTNLESLLDSMAPSTLAKLAVLVGALASPEMEDDEFLAVMDLSGAAFDAGVRNCGQDFSEEYFGAVIENAD